MPQPVRHTLDQLLVVEAIAATGSFAAAARQLHRVPSAVSHTVSKLEEAVGVELFDRSGHRCTLTAAGRRVLDAGEEVLAAARRLDLLADGLQAGWEPHIQVVADGALDLVPVLGALRRFIAEGHPTRIRLDVEHRQGVIERFEADGADLMLVLGLEEAEGCVVRPLPPLEMVLVAGVTHPLARLGRVARVDLAEHIELLVRDTSTSVKDGAEAWFGEGHRIHLSDFPTKRLALLEGLGFGWMPRNLVKKDIDAASLQVLPLVEGEGRWTWQPLLVRKADRVQGPASQRFETLLLQALGVSKGARP